MTLASLTIGLIQGVALLVSAAAVGLAVRMGMDRWYDRSRTMFLAVGGIAVLGNAAVIAVEWAGGRAGQGWLLALRLVTQIALPAFFLMLLGAMRRRDAAARAQARDAPFNRITNLPNLAMLQRQIAPALARCRRHGTPATVLVIAVDGLDDVLARRGPGQASEMMVSLAGVVRDATPSGDLSGHLEPYLLCSLLVDADIAAAEGVAAGLRALAAERMVDPAMTGRRVTLSIGMAAIRDGAEPAALEEATSAARLALRSVLAAGGDGVGQVPGATAT